MATIERRERKTGVVYLADVRIRGFPRQKKTFRRLTDARNWAQRTEAAIRDGEFRNVIKTAKSKTLKNVIERYRADVLPHKAATTQRGEKLLLQRWETLLGEYTLSYIDAELINAKLRDLALEGDLRRQAKQEQDGQDEEVRPKSRRTIKYFRDLLALLFKYARKWGWIGSDPMEGVDPITKLRNERTRYLDEDERKALLKACQASSNRQLYPLVILALGTGARRGEILSLTLDDVDLEREIAVLRNTKNRDIRALPLMGHVKEVLKEHIAWVKSYYEELEEKPKKRWLFPSQNGQAPIDIRRPWEMARDAAGLVDFRFHDLRHSTASYLAMNGASQLEIAEVLGHRTLQMVKRYAHLSESHVKGILERLDTELH